MLLYQNELTEYVNSLSLNTLKHTTLIKGDIGCGKHTLCNLISEKLNIPLVDLTDNLNLDVINEIYVSTQPTLYLIDSDKITIKEQNTILKFLEEPCNVAYILLINSNNKLLDTIVNRCFILNFKPYTKDNLKTFINIDIDVESLLSICRTPGDVISYSSIDFNEMIRFADKIFRFIKTANLSNCLTIANKISFGTDSKDLFDVDLFSRVLLSVSKNISVEVYKLTNELCNNLTTANINKKNLVEKYIVDLKYTI